MAIQSNSALAQAYRGILGRDPDPDGYKWWSNELSSGRVKQDQIAHFFTQSDEFSQRRAGSLSIDGQFGDLIDSLTSSFASASRAMSEQMSSSMAGFSQMMSDMMAKNALQIGSRDMSRTGASDLNTAESEAQRRSRRRRNVSMTSASGYGNAGGGLSIAS